MSAESDNLIFAAASQATPLRNAEVDGVDEIADCDKTETSAEEQTDEHTEEELPLSFLDTPYNYLSARVESIARNLDEFFSSDKVFYKTSGTNLRVREDLVWSDGAGIRIKDNVRLKLQLPHTQQKIRFVFQSGVKKWDFDDLERGQDSSLVAPGEDENYLAEIEGAITETSGWKFKPSIGAYLGATIDPYVKFRFNRQQQLDKWSINWDETPYWVESIGWAFDSYFELNRKIADNDLFRSETYAGWRNDTDYFDLSQVFSLNYILTTKKAVSYFAGIYGISEPKINTTQYLLYIRYRENIYKDYLFLEIKPEVKYQKINNFRAEHSLIFRFEMIFKE